MSHNYKFSNSLDNFFKRFINTTNANTGHLPITRNEVEWSSLCQQGKPFLSEDMQDSIYWQPILKKSTQDMQGLEKALEIKLHPDISTFFCRYWSEQIDAIFEQGNLSLLFVWNETDMQRLIENQLGHAFHKICNKQNLTFFIACTDADYIISVENQSGQVVLERPGYAIEKILSPNLTQFINELEYGRLG